MTRYRLAKTVAGALLASTAPLPTAEATELGYGSFIGTFEVCTGKPAACVGKPSNPTPSNVSEVGQLILDVLDPDPFLLSEFNLAGGTGSYEAGLTQYNGSTEGFQVTYVNGTKGTWSYEGFAADPPGDDPIDLYIAVKYANYFSVFYYQAVEVGDTGTFTSDGALVPVSFGTCTFVNSFSECMPYNPAGNAAQGISHVVGYWPPSTGTDPGCTTCVPVPEPGTLALFGAGLAALGLIRRRRV